MKNIIKINFLKIMIHQILNNNSIIVIKEKKAINFKKIQYF